MEQAKIVQLEFFHVDTGIHRDLRAFDAECHERMALGSPLKTVVRLYDDGQHMERFIKKWQVSRRYMRRLRRRYDAAQGLRKLWLGRQYLRQFASLSVEEEERERLEFAQTFFTEQLELWEGIAYELPDHSFRPVRDDEVYDLRTATSKAKSVWISVFAPNDLCADLNTGFAHAR